MRNLTLRVLFGAALAMTQIHCSSSPPKVDTFNAATLKAGNSHTLALKFWMLDSGIKGEGIAPNLHFDDAAGNRVVFWMVKDLPVNALTQGNTYQVTFTYEDGDPNAKGTVTSFK